MQSNRLVPPFYHVFLNMIEAGHQLALRVAQRASVSPWGRTAEPESGTRNREKAMPVAGQGARLFR